MSNAISAAGRESVNWQDGGGDGLSLQGSKSQLSKPAEAKQEGGTDLGAQVRGIFDQNRGQNVYSMI